MKRKVCVIGLDGVTFNLIKPWAEAGELPTFARLLREGSYGDLLSTPDMVSPAAWTSFATGRNPGNHGIFNFADTIPGSLDIHYMTSRHRHGETIWSVLNKHSKKTCVLNVPMTYPADPVDGCMISGWNAPTVQSEGFTHPAGLITEITEKFGEYPLFPTVKKYIVEGRPDLAFKNLQENLDINENVTKHLMATYDWDLFISVFIATDQVQHYFWHYMDPTHPLHPSHDNNPYRDAILQVYKRCDAIIADIAAQLDKDTTLVIMSDHGCGKNQGGVSYLPLWIRKAGFATDKLPTSSLVNMPKILVGRALKLAYNTLNKHISVKAKGKLNALMPKLRDKIESSWRFSQYDWPKTQVYFHYEPRINLKGREPYGIISAGEEYEKLRNILIEKLVELRDLKTGVPLVQKVFRGEDAYHGMFTSQAPDIVIWWNEDVVISGMKGTDLNGDPLILEDTYLDDQRTGNHTPYGIFIAAGPDIKAGNEVSGMQIIDAAPTLLYLMDTPVPLEMDGVVRQDLFTDDFVRNNKICIAAQQSPADDYDSGYSNEDDAKIQQRLKDLGYL